MKTLQHILTLVMPECFMAIFDLQDAYLVTPIASEHIRFLKFTWRGKVYVYVVLPFGLSEAPRKFTKLLKPILAKLRRQGVILAIYIDDGWVKGDTFLECYHNILATVKLFVRLGFLMHITKSVPLPAQQVSILGFDIDSMTMLITVGEEKTRKAIHLCSQALQLETMTIRHLAKIIGTLISLFPACPLGKAHYRSLETIKFEALSLHRWDWEAHCSIYGQAISDIHWWLRELPHMCSRIDCGYHNMTVFFDASDFQWEAVFQGHPARGRFPPHQAAWHINTKETMAIYYAILAFRPYFMGDHLLIRCNNTTAIATVWEMGTLKCSI